MAFLYALPGAVAEGLIWGLMAIGVYISYKILYIADLTVDGSICTGACVCAVLLAGGMPVWLAILLAFLAGALTGTLTGLFHTALGIPSILAVLCESRDPGQQIPDCSECADDVLAAAYEQ